jgi:peptide/nickel transport system ATP-binding protein
LSRDFVTHEVSVAVDVADRIAVMYAGGIVEIGSVHEVIDAAAPEAMAVGAAHFVRCVRAGANPSKEEVHP